MFLIDFDEIYLLIAGLPLFQPTPFAFIDGEVHSRNDFRGSEKEE